MWERAAGVVFSFEIFFLQKFWVVS